MPSVQGQAYAGPTPHGQRYRFRGEQPRLPTPQASHNAAGRIVVPLQPFSHWAHFRPSREPSTVPASSRSDATLPRWGVDGHRLVSIRPNRDRMAPGMQLANREVWRFP